MLIMTDKRILKTRANIKTALMELSVEKPIAKITVSNLTEKACINRSTFYLHYNDVNDVLKEIDCEIEACINELLEALNIADLYKSTYSFFINLTGILNENSAIKNYILNSTLSNIVINRIKEILIDKTKQAILSVFPDTKESELEYPLSFAAAGIMDCYFKWVHSENPEFPIEKLIQTVSVLVHQILEYLNIA